MRSILFAVAALAMVAGSAAAQVAAPTMNPVPAFTAVPGNPAVLSWDKPSRIGAFYANATLADGTGAEIGTGHFTAVQAQAVGEYFAAGVVGAKLDVDIDPIAQPVVGGPKVVQRFSTVVGAVKPTDWVSAGISRETDRREINGEVASRVTTGGLTLRFGGVFYLGAVMGKDTIETSLLPNQDAKRDLMRYGAGIRWENASGGVHLEAFKENRDGALLPFAVDQSSVGGGTLEVRFARVGLSFTTHDRTDINQNNGVVSLKQKIESLHLFFATQGGVAFSIGQTRLNASQGGPNKATFNSVGAAYLF